MNQKRSVYATLSIIFIPIFLVCICGFCFMMSLLIMSSNPTLDNITEKELRDGDKAKKIAVIDIEGTIASSEDPLGSGQSDMVDNIISKLDKAKDDESVKGVILRLNTPGGTVYDSHIISEKVQEIREDKPVVSLMGMSATSGGYYIASSSNKIVASETTLTGSIGVIMQTIKYDELYKKIGLESIEITNSNSDMKTLKNIDQEGSPDRAILEKVLNDYYESFIQTIIDGRNMDRTKLLDIADGSIYSGKEALNLGLVDSLGGIDEAITQTEELANINDAQVVYYSSYIDPFSNFKLFVSKQINPLAKVTDKIQSEPGVYMYYLPE